MINRDAFVAGVISKWIDAGLKPAEMEKCATLLATFLELADSKGANISELVNQGLDKNASPLNWIAEHLPWELVGKAITGIGSKGLQVGENVIGETIKAAPGLALTAGALGIAAPLALGYGAGKYFGDMTDQGDEAIKTLKDQELLRALRESAEYAKQRKRQYQKSAE